MVIRIDTSKAQLKRYKYKRGKGLVNRVKKLQKTMTMYKPEAKMLPFYDNSYYVSNKGLVILPPAAQFGGVIMNTVGRIPIGDESDQRSGATIRMTKVDFCFDIQTTWPSESVRAYLVYFQDVVDINLWTYPGSIINKAAYGTIVAPETGNLPHIQRQYKCSIVYDSGPRRMNGTTGSISNKIILKGTKKLNKKANYSQEPNDSLRNGSLVWFVVGTQPEGTTTPTTVVFNYQLHYTDN